MSRWQQMAETMGVEYQPWSPPDYGGHDRKHFDYEHWRSDQMALEAEVEQLRQVSRCPEFTAADRPDKTSRPEDTAVSSPCTERLQAACDFLARLDLVIT